MNVSIRTRRLFITMLSFAGAVALFPVRASAASGTKTLAANTKFFVRAPDQAAVSQIEQLALHGDVPDAVRLANMALIPQAVWLDGGTPAAVTSLVETTLLEAELERT